MRAPAKKKIRPPPRNLKDAALAPELIAKASIAPAAPKIGSLCGLTFNARKKLANRARLNNANKTKPTSPSSASICRYSLWAYTESKSSFMAIRSLFGFRAANCARASAYFAW